MAKDVNKELTVAVIEVVRDRDIFDRLLVEVLMDQVRPEMLQVDLCRGRLAHIVEAHGPICAGPACPVPDASFAFEVAVGALHETTRKNALWITRGEWDSASCQSPVQIGLCGGTL